MCSKAGKEKFVNSIRHLVTTEQPVEISSDLPLCTDWHALLEHEESTMQKLNKECLLKISINVL